VKQWNFRKHLVPLGNGPWLHDRSMHAVWKRLVGWGLALALGSYLLGHAFLSTHRYAYNEVPWSLFLVLPLFGGLLLMVLGFFWGLATLMPPMAQTCPHCLRGMTIGATTCPHCHFHPPQEEG
jgi:VIT1/CCC1 family predicted Fe2+/Mn2+ transporter